MERTSVTERQGRIGKILQEKQGISILELVELFSISEMTIRRDLDKLGANIVIANP